MNSSNDKVKSSNALNEDVEDEQEEKKKLSFKAKLSAFENLAKVEPKKPIEKTPPVKNKLRMSSSNNLIADKKNDEKHPSEEQPNNFSKRFTSISNENLSKSNSPTQQDKDLNTRVTKLRPELNLTKSESNLNTDQKDYLTNQNLNQTDHTQSDQQINNSLLNQNEINKFSDLVDTRSSIEVISNKDKIRNSPEQHQFDCDFEVSELSKRMQHQLSTSPNLLNQNNLATNNHLSTNHSTSNIHPTAIHQHQYINSMEELSTNPINNHQTATNNFYNDDYNNSQLYNPAITSHNLIINNLPKHVSDFSIDSSNQFYSPVVNKQNVSSSILPQTVNGFYDENVGVYGNYCNTANQSANAYQLQKHNRSTSSSHLEYTNGLPPVTNQIYYQNKSSALNSSGGNLNNCLSGQSYSATQLMNRQSQPQLNISSTNQSTQPTQSYNYNHWLIQEAELRRQIATRNGTSLITSAKNSQNLQSKTNQLGVKANSNNIHKDDQPVYENTIIYNNHKKQQQLLTNSMSYLGNQQQPQINKPAFPNPSMITNNQNSTMHQLNTSPTDNQLGQQQNYLTNQQQKQQKQILSVSGKKKCSNCGDELGRGCAAMVIESLSLYFHINCFRCSVCHLILGNGQCGTDVRVRNNKLNCIDCYSNDEGKGIFY